MANKQDDMEFYDRYTPGIQSGTYRYILQHTVKLEIGGDGSQTFHYRRDQEFVVSGPRYSIGAEDIHSYYPPSGGQGDYEGTMPHIVFRKRSLPWERELANPAPKDAPWLALLTLSETDTEGDTPMLKAGDVERCLPGLGKSDFCKDERGRAVRLPKISLESDVDKKAKIQVIDLPAKVFRSLCPTIQDLRFLAHLRCVNTAEKAPQNMHAEGEFSSVVANRFSQPGLNTVYLVSLEGWEEFLQQPVPKEEDRVRLIALAHWSFTWDTNGAHTFKNLVQELNSDAMALSSGTANKNLGKLTDEGYVPLDYGFANGAKTITWYRGPFAPLVSDSIAEAVPPFPSSDAALVLDTYTGMMDVSYAAAWEIGRLIALSCTAYSKAMEAFSYEGGVFDYADRIAQFLTDHATALHDADSVTRYTVDGDTKTLPKAANTESAADNENTSRALVVLDFVDAIARLALLYPVPVNYLVADPNLLPAESLRFFHIDKSWIEALIDGALSPALSRSKDSGKISRAKRRTTLNQLVHQHFRRLANKSPETNPDKMQWFMTEPLSGFLLRSALVSGWPGIEIEVKTSDARRYASVPPVLRMEPIGEDTLFGLVRGSIKSVTFTEPREGWTFGNKGEIPPLYRQTGLPGVLDINGMTKDRKEPSPYGAAGFARDMLQGPLKQEFSRKV